MAEPPTNPYPGPRPFLHGETLYGRDQEITKLFYLLSAERIVVLHSPSGAGKSSLLNAGLVPRLRAEHFDVWPTIRLSQPAANGGNRFVTSAVSSLEEGLPEGRRRPAETIAGLPLGEYVAGRPRRPGAPASIVLVFDQFEEILTVDPLGVEARREFFRQLGQVLENPDVWSLFALREDYLGALDPYRDDVPTRLSNAFRVDLLTVDAARDAIAKPAGDAGREFAPAAAATLAEDLATISVQQPDGSFQEDTGLYVEPLQLQVVCRRLWDELPAETRTIGVENLLASGDVDAALAAYYDGSVAETAGVDVPAERGIREWFGDRLITAGGIRGQVLREQSATGGLDNESVDRLVGTHLVRSEQRDGKTWLELAHDRLVTPVRDSNAAWLEQHLHPMQRQAVLWEREGRPDSLLLRGQELEDAERWARDNPTFMRPVETDLLSLSARRRQEERRRRRTLIAIGVGLLALVALFATLGAWALVQRSDAKRATTSAGVLAAAAGANDPTTPLDLSLLLSLAAYQAKPTSSEARSSAISALEAARKSGVALILHGHTDVVLDVAYSPDERTVASAGADGTVRLWDVLAQRPLGVLGGNGGVVSSVAFRRDGQTLASAGADGKIRVRDVRSQRLLDERPSGGTVNGVEFSHDGHMLATAGMNALTLWEVRRDGVLRFLRRVGGTFKAVAFDGDGRTLASTDFGEGVNLWTVPGLKWRDALWSGSSFNGVAFGPDGRTLAAGSDDNNVYVRGPDGGHVLEGHGNSVYGVAFSRDGTLASSSADGTIRLWHNRTHRRIRVLRSGAGALPAVSFSPDGRTLASAGPDRAVQIWNVHPHRQQPLEQEGPVTSVAFSNDGRTVAAGSGEDSDYAIWLWDVRSHKLMRELSGHTDVVSDVAFSPDRPMLASSSWDGTIRLWSLRSHKTLHELPSGGGKELLVAFSHDGDTLASVRDDGTIHLWDLRTSPPRKKKLQGSDGYEHFFHALAFSPDGHTLATRGPDRDTVRLWDVRTRKKLEPLLRGHTNWVVGLAFSRDGRALASSGWDGTVRLWDVQSHRPLGVLRGHTDLVKGVAFSPDGGTVFSAGDDSTVRLWDVRNGQELGPPLRLHPGSAANDVAVSPDGRTLASASDFWTVDLWQNILFRNPSDLRAQVCGLVVGSLTRAEWAEFAPGLASRTICPS